MNICKSKIVVVPETDLAYEIRIDLVKSKIVSESRVGWHHLGIDHIAAYGTKLGEGRFIVTIQGVKPSQLNHASCTHLVTQSRVAANALYNAWCEWAQNEAKVQDEATALEVRLLPKHSDFWHL